MKKPLIIGIAGGSGSGKTTLAERIAAHFGDAVATLRHDDYYKEQKGLSLEARAAINYDHPDAFDTDLLIKHLDALCAGCAIDAPMYDYTVHDRSDRVRRVEPRDVVLLEGILILENKALRERLDIKLFVDTDADVRILRRIVRDVKGRGRSLDSVIGQYLATVKPMHEAFVEPSKKHADLIVPEGGKNAVAFELIIARLEALLENK
ncbi:MAG: uridine kinase [Clostridia bacterium]|nr:uridine kinase [Clostridia bacterium]